jgi:hypothetical protein
VTDWEHYSDTHRQSARTFHVEPVQEIRRQAMQRRAVGTVLDVGGGDGYVTRGVRDVTVTDIAFGRGERVMRPEEGPPMPFVQADACALPFADRSFDTVMFGEILEHMDNPGLAFGEACRIARQRVVMSIPLGGWEDPTHLWRISLDDCFDKAQHDRQPTNGRQLVLTWQRGECWPHGYWERDRAWQEQFVEGH